MSANTWAFQSLKSINVVRLNQYTKVRNVTRAITVFAATDNKQTSKQTNETMPSTSETVCRKRQQYNIACTVICF